MNFVELGLTFYGGLSLAVYESGVACAILRLLAEKAMLEHGDRPAEPISAFANHWHIVDEKHLSDANIEINSISGASAGALVAVLMGIGLSLPPDVIPEYIDIVQQFWLEYGCVRKLLPQKQEGKLNSVLVNTVISNAIVDLLSKADALRSKSVITSTLANHPDKINIFISVTNYRGCKSAGIKQLPNEISFNMQSTFSIANFITNDPSWRRWLGDLLCVTTAFPLIFPLYCDATRSSNDRGYFADGGITDNKPIGSVARSLCQTEASEHTKRILVLINPQYISHNPPHTPNLNDIRFIVDNEISFLRQLKDMLIPAISYRSIVSDLEFLNSHNELVRNVKLLDKRIRRSVEKGILGKITDVENIIENMEFDHFEEALEDANRTLEELDTKWILGHLPRLGPVENEEEFLEQKEFMRKYLSTYHNSLISSLKLIDEKMRPFLKLQVSRLPLNNEIQIAPITPRELICGKRFFGIAGFMSKTIRERDFVLGYLDGLTSSGELLDSNPLDDAQQKRIPPIGQCQTIISRPDYCKVTNIINVEIRENMDILFRHVENLFRISLPFKLLRKSLLMAFLIRCVFAFIKSKYKKKALF